jgi:hypothetical protein
LDKPWWLALKIIIYIWPIKKDLTSFWMASPLMILRRIQIACFKLV